MHKDMTNLEITDLLRSIAATYQLNDEEINRFKIIAYQKAADAVEHLSSEAKDLWDEGKLEEIPGVGKSISEHLDEIFRTGKSQHFKEMMKNLPLAMFELMKVPGIGPKSAYKLATQLKISVHNPLSQLEKAVREGIVANMEGFGDKSQDEILKALDETRGRQKRLLLPFAQKLAGELIQWLKNDKNVIGVDCLGSLRRMASTVGDIDISVSSEDPHATIEHFLKYPNAQRTLEKGERKAVLLLPGDIQVDLRVQKPDSYGSLLQHFTGSKHHNVALREYAIKKGYSLSEYGIKELKTKNAKLNTFETEEEFYQFLGLKLIPPELREDLGEIQAARENKLPQLVQLADIRADLQIHSDFDVETSHDLGLSSMQEIVDKANLLGYEYLAFTEHNPSRSKHSREQMKDILKRKKDAVEQINYSISKQSSYRVKKVFNSLEIDMMSEGDLPVPDSGLELLDFALVSIHSNFRLSRGQMTERVLKALSHPKVKIFAHPTGRKLNHREGVELDWERVFDFCLKNNKWIEINADPMRLDLPDFLVREAVKKGIKLTLGTDAHHEDSMDNMVNGVSVARRGWATEKDIVNTLGLEEFEKMLI